MQSDASHPWEAPGAGKLHARICEGKSRMAELLDQSPPRHLDWFLPMGHPAPRIQTRAGALTNLLPWQGGLPKGDVAEKWQMQRAPAPLVE
jgi:hypothetical protein